MKIEDEVMAAYVQKVAADWHDEYRRLKFKKNWSGTAAVCQEKAEFNYRAARLLMGVENHDS